MKRYNTLDSIGDVKRNLARLSRELFKERRALRHLTPEDSAATAHAIAIARVRVEQSKALVSSLKALADIIRDAELEARLEALERRRQEQHPEATQ